MENALVRQLLQQGREVKQAVRKAELSAGGRSIELRRYANDALRIMRRSIRGGAAPYTLDKSKVFTQKGRCAHVAISGDGETLVVLTSMSNLLRAVDYTITVRNLRDGEVLKEFTKNANAPREVAISHDGRVVAFQERDTNNCNVWIWDSHTMEYRMTTIVHGHGGASIPVSMTPDGSRILTGGELERGWWKALKVWWIDGLKPSVIVEHRYSTIEDITSAVLSADGKFALSVYRKKTIQVWDMDENYLSGPYCRRGSGQCLRKYRSENKDNYPYSNLSIAAKPVQDRSRVVISRGEYDRRMEVWSLKSNGTLEKEGILTSDVESMALSETGAIAASTGRRQPRKFEVWDVQNRERIDEIQSTMGIMTMAMSANGGRIVLGGHSDYTVDCRALEPPEVRVEVWDAMPSRVAYDAMSTLSRMDGEMGALPGPTSAIASFLAGDEATRKAVDRFGTVEDRINEARARKNAEEEEERQRKRQRI